MEDIPAIVRGVDLIELDKELSQRQGLELFLTGSGRNSGRGGAFRCNLGGGGGGLIFEKCLIFEPD